MKKIVLFASAIALLTTTGCFFPGRGGGWHDRDDGWHGRRGEITITNNPPVVAVSAPADIEVPPAVEAPAPPVVAPPPSLLVPVTAVIVP